MPHDGRMERSGCAQKQQANQVVLHIPVPLQDGQEGPAPRPPLRARRLCGGDQHLRLKHDQSCHSINAVWIHVGGMRSRNLIQALSDGSLFQDINHRFVISFRNTVSLSVNRIHGTAVMVASTVSNLTLHADAADTDKVVQPRCCRTVLSNWCLRAHPA
jgi:hypothetical protein